MKLSKEEKEKLTKEQFRHYKLTGELPVDETRRVNLDNGFSEKITVLCVRFGHKYGPDYVERLRNMVSRHLTVPYEFVCLTDDPNPIPGVRSVVQSSAGYIKPWWHKIHMFDPSLDLSGRILYLDLDVVICNNINKLVVGLKNEFMGIRDFNRKFHANWKYLNSSVMSWVHGSQGDIWNRFSGNSAAAQRMHGDQDWTWHIAKDRIQFWPVEWIQSYKWEIRSRDELVERTGKKGFKFIAHGLQVNPNCSIAVFHGDPNPDAVPDPFVVDNWR